jgi:hypothetical protein
MGRATPADGWINVAASDYEAAFARYGGSFPVHPRVVRLASELAGREPRYMGVERGGEIIAAVPLWGARIAATHAALSFYRVEHLLDFGEPEVVLPIRPGAKVSMPFVVDMVSSLHEADIAGLKLETSGKLTLVRGLEVGQEPLSGRNKKNLRRKLRNLDALGASYRPIGELPASEAADIFARLYEMRWQAPTPYLGTLHRVFAELHDLLAGDILYIDGRPAAIEHIYLHEAGGRLFVNGVQAGWNQAYREHSVGSLLLFRNLEAIEALATSRGLEMRYSLGWDDQGYKDQWTYAVPAYRRDAPRTIGSTVRSVRRRLAKAFGGPAAH